MSGYSCVMCNGGEPATILITPLVGGDTMPVGQECMATTFTGMLAGTLGIDAEDLGKAVDRLTKARDAKAAKQATEDRKAAEAEGQADEDGPGPGADGPTGNSHADLQA